MARRHYVEIECDLEKPGVKKAAHTMTFTAPDGAVYEVDVCDDHERRVQNALDAVQVFAQLGQLAEGAVVPRPKKAKAKSGANEARAIREWAAANGVEVNRVGRVPDAIRDQWLAAGGTVR